MYQIPGNAHALRPYRLENRRPANPFTQAERIEGLSAYLDDQQPAKVVEHINMNRLHGEALAMNEKFDDDLFMDVLEAWPEIDDTDWFDDDFELDHWNDPASDLADDHWLPYARSMEEVRDIFNGGDFIIVHNFRA